MYDAKAVTGAPIDDAVKYIAAQLKEHPDASVYVMGYSAGGDAAISLAKALEQRGISVAGLVTFDPHGAMRLYGKCCPRRRRLHLVHQIVRDRSKFRRKGRTATHEFEIGTSFPSSGCAPGCVFKTKEKQVEDATFKPVKPAALSFNNLTGTTAKANWENASPDAAISSYEWRIGIGSWNSTTTSPANVNSLSPNTTYSFEVRAVDTSGLRGASATGTFTTPIAITLSNRTVSITLTAGSFSPAQATYKIASTGDILTSASNNTSEIDVGDWLNPKVSMSTFQVRKSGGSCSNGPSTNMWIQLTNSPSWNVVMGGPTGTASCWFSIDISAVANPSVILGSATITLVASK